MSRRAGRRLQLRHRWRPPLRLRLALWSGGLVLILSVALVLFINVAARVIMPSEMTVALPDVAFPRATWVAGQPTPTPLPAGSQSAVTGGPIPAVLVPQAVLQHLQTISVLGLGAVFVLGSAGAYWLAGQALRPVGQVSRAARQISASTLDKRLALAGPDDELTELAKAFNTMLERLERSFEQQSRFVADAAHELRTPLASLRTTLEIIRDDPQATLADYHEMVLTLEQALARLEQLVADLLVLATAERAFPSGEVALGPLLEDVLLDMTPLADEHQVALRLAGESDVSVRGSESLLAHAFRNLIENGIHYNRPGGEVTVALARDERWAVVTVADTGSGIAPHKQVRIFERFYRGSDSRGRRPEGSGLGLSIVAHIVGQHGGHIQVESAPGAGSTFTVQLPRHVAP